MWSPNGESELRETLKKETCMQCNTISLVNNSGFVMRETNCRTSLDPSSSRKIHYEVPRSKKETRLPEGIEDSSELQQQEYIQSSAMKLRIHTQSDLGRKNQKTSSVAITLYIPTPYNKEKTMASIKEELGAAGIEVDTTSVGPEPQHVVDMHCYHEGKEYIMEVVATRIKLSLSCNKTIETNLDVNDLEAIKMGFGNLSCCVSRRNDMLTVDLPSNQTSKRFGIQTFNASGEVLQHESKIIVTPAGRKQTKKQTNQRFDEQGPMLSAINFWCNPDWTKQHNFLRFGQSVLGGLVNNLYVQGNVNLANQVVCLLPKGKFKWVDLHQIEGVMNVLVLDALWNAKSKQIQQQLVKKDEELAEMRNQLDKQKAEVTHCTDTKLEQMQKTIDDLQADLQRVTKERDQLREEKRSLERELRALRRSHDILQDEQKELKNRLEQQEKENNYMQDEIKGLKSANASIIAKTEELEKAMQKHQRLMNNTFPQEWSEDIDTSLIQVF